MEDYEITRDGRVFSLKYGKRNLMKTRINKFGYEIVSLCFNGKSRTFKLHQLVANAFIPNPLNLPQINHIDGVKSNNNDWNLERCTQSHNMKEAYRLGLIGFNVRNSKVIDIQVREIRTLFLTGLYTHQQLATMYDVTRSCIWRIINYKNWINL